MAKTTESTPKLPEWDTPVKLGAIEEANYVAVDDVVSSVDRATGEITVRRASDKPPFGRSREAV